MTREFSDTSGDAAFAYLDIEDVKVSVYSQRIEVDITLLDVPSLFNVDAAELTLEQRTVTDDEGNETLEPRPTLEYSWQVSFDTSCRGDASGDVRIALTNYKFPNELPGRDSLLDFTHAQVWQVDSSGELFKATDDVVTATLDENVLTLSVTRATSATQSIFAGTPVRIIASHNLADTTYYDSFPEGYPAQNAFYTNAEAMAAAEESESDAAVETEAP